MEGARQALPVWLIPVHGWLQRASAPSTLSGSWEWELQLSSPPNQQAHKLEIINRSLTTQAD